MRARIRHVTIALGMLAAIGLLGALALGGDDAPDLDGCLPATVALSATPDSASRVALDGRLLVANRFAGTATHVDLATGRTTRLRVGRDAHEAAVSPDGRWGVVTNFGPRRDGHYVGNRVFVIDMATGRLARTIHLGDHQGLHDVAFRPGHPTRALVTAQTSGRVVEVDVAAGVAVGAVATHGDRSHMLAVSPDGRTAYTTNEGTATISRLDLAAGRFDTAFAATPNVEGVAVAADGRELWVGEPALGAVTVRDAATGRVLATLAGFRHPVRLEATRDGRRVVVSDPSCRAIHVADVAARQVVRTIRLPYEPPVLVGALSADGRVAFASVTEERAAIAVDLETGRLLARHRAGWEADGVGWGPRPTVLRPTP